jgi:NADH-quinone oxidoreductase subunit M
LVLLGAFIANPMIAGASTFVMILAAVYLLYMYQRVFTGPLSPFLKGLGSHLTDVTPTEILTLAPLAAMIVVFGVMPTILTSSFAKSVETFLMSAISVVGQ